MEWATSTFYEGKHDEVPSDAVEVKTYTYVHGEVELTVLMKDGKKFATVYYMTGETFSFNNIEEAFLFAKDRADHVRALTNLMGY